MRSPAAESAGAAVEYFGYEGAAGKFFRCDAYRATLSTDACAQRWREAQQAKGWKAQRYEKCRGCPLGALHAGERVCRASALYGVDLCARCHRWASRLIGGRLCPSCYNRTREFVLDRNRKGTRPRFRFDLRRIGLIVTIDDAPQYFEIAELCADTIEIAIGVLRNVGLRVQFCAPRGAPALGTAELLAKLGADGPSHQPRTVGGRWAAPRAAKAA